MADVNVGTLSVKITADTKGVRKGINDTTKALDAGNKKLRDGSKEWNDWSVKSTAATVAVAAAAGLAARAIVGYSDTFTSITNKLKLATDGTADLAFVTSEMFRIANETGSAVDATSELYAKMERATRDLGVSQDRLLKITGSINKAFAISGATTQESAGAIRQLGQALASGALRGDEFNSIAEQAPIIMEAVRKETGLAAGALRDMAADGEITSELLIKSLENYANVIDTDFSSAQKTFEQKMEIARNNAIEFVGANDKMTGAVGLAGDAVKLLSENLEIITNVAAIAGLVFTTRFVAPMIAAGLASDKFSISALRAAASATTLKTAMGFIGGPLGVAILAAAALLEFGEFESEVAEKTKEATDEIKEQIKAVEGLSDQLRLSEEQNETQSKLNELMAQRADALRDVKDKQIELNTATREGVGILAGIAEATALSTAKQKLESLEKELTLQKQLATAIFEKRLAGKQSDAEENQQVGEDIIAQIEAEIAIEARLLEQARLAKAEKEEEARIREMEARRLDGELFAEELTKRFATATQLENIFYTEELERLQNSFDNKKAVTAEQFLLEDQLKTEHEKNLTRIQQDEERARVKSITDTMGAIASALDAGGKKSQAIGKKIAIARAILSGGQAAVDAWRSGMEMGGPFAPLVAASYAAASIARTSSMISSIKGGSTPTAGSGSVPTVSQTATAPAAESEAPTAARTISIETVGGGFLTTEMVRDLIGQINEQVGDGVELNVTGG